MKREVIIMFNFFKKEIKKYDKRGNLIYHRDDLGIERWYEYDKNGNETYYKYHAPLPDSKDFISRTSYDKNGNKVAYVNSDGHKIIFRYDENNRLVYQCDNTGYQKFYQYDEQGEPTYIKVIQELEYKNSHTYAKFLDADAAEALKLLKDIE